MAAKGTPVLRIFVAARAALAIEGKVTTATLVDSGMTASLSVISVINPNVPSAPTKSDVRLYPADVFLENGSVTTGTKS
jgi:hypothetical protein